MKISSLLPFACFAEDRLDYSGYKVIRAEWIDPIVSQDVEKILGSAQTLNLWTPEFIEQIHDTRYVDFMIAQHEIDNITNLLRMNTVSVDTMIEDAGALIEEQRIRSEQATATRSAGDYPYTEYLKWEELEEWVEYVAETYPDTTELKQIGTTENGRRILGLHMGDKNHNSEKKKIFMECGIHAREWISSASCRYFMNQVLSANADPNFPVKDSLPYNADDLRGLLDFNWYIILSANPDGYSHTHTNDRMWRKNRATNPNTVCVGVDLNRQFPVGHLTSGGSTNPCSATYASTAPLNQEETMAWDKWIKEVMDYEGGELAAQISVHSYSQLLMPPYATGRRTGERPNEPSTIDYMMAVTETMGDAITATHGLKYSVGQSRDVVGYAAGGTTEDYSYDDLKIPLTWVYELRDTGRYGFLLPPEQIEPTSEEVINSFMPMAAELRNPTGP